MKKILMVMALLLGGVVTSFAQSGYRGFADISLGAGFCDNSGFNALLTTTHGYQCNGHIFVGGGLGVGYSGAGRSGYSSEELVGMMLPIYAAFRYDYSLTSRHSFFATLRAGYDMVADDSVYASPEFGVRFGRNSSISYNLGLRIDVLYSDYMYYTMVAPMVAFGIEF